MNKKEKSYSLGLDIFVFLEKTLIYIFRFISHVFKEIEIGIVFMHYAVCAGQSHKCSCKFAVFTIFIRIFCGIKDLSDFFIGLAVIAPFEPGLSSLYINTVQAYLHQNRQNPVFLA